MRILASQIGTLVNYISLSSDTGLSFREVKEFFNVLEETFILSRLRPFYRNLATELRKSPKAYFYDSGLRNAVLDNFSPLEFREDRGRLAEEFVFSLLARYYTKKRIRFWRTKAKAEVDFCLFPPDKEEVVPIEIKFTRLKEEKFGKSFLSFIRHYRPSRAVIFNRNLSKIVPVGPTQVLFYPLWLA